MKTYIAIFIFFQVTGFLHAPQISPDQWTYISIDTSREMMKPAGGPDWLRSFGIDVPDINRDGLSVDRGETHNLSGDYPEKLSELVALWEAQRNEIIEQIRADK